MLLETDPAKARSAARQALAPYLQLDNYVNNWRRLGFGDDEIAGGGSDRFIDANVAWGDEEAIRARIQEHWDAGADHVCIQSIHPDGSRRPRREDARAAGARWLEADRGHMPVACDGCLEPVPPAPDIVPAVLER